MRPIEPYFLQQYPSVTSLPAYKKGHPSRGIPSLAQTAITGICRPFSHPPNRTARSNEYLEPGAFCDADKFSHGTFRTLHATVDWVTCAGLPFEKMVRIASVALGDVALQPIAVQFHIQVVKKPAAIYRYSTSRSASAPLHALRTRLVPHFGKCFPWPNQTMSRAIKGFAAFVFENELRGMRATIIGRRTPYGVQSTPHCTAHSCNFTLLPKE
jgi:hypothetical protein